MKANNIYLNNVYKKENVLSLEKRLMMRWYLKKEYTFIDTTINIFFRHHIMVSFLVLWSYTSLPIRLLASIHCVLTCITYYPVLISYLDQCL